MSAIISRYGIITYNIDDQTKNQLINKHTITKPLGFVQVIRSRNGWGNSHAAPEKVPIFYTDSESRLILPRWAIQDPSINHIFKDIQLNIAETKNTFLNPPLNPLLNPPLNPLLNPLLNSSTNDENNEFYTIQLTPNQEVIINHLMTYYFNQQRINFGLATALLQLNTGMGKTYIAAELIYRLGRKTLWILPNTSILNQTIDVLETGFPTLKIGQYHASKKDSPIHHDIILVIIDSLVTIARSGTCSCNHLESVPGKKRPKKTVETFTSAEWMSYFGLTIYDEVHMYTGPVDSTIFWFFSANIAFGMSATVSESTTNMDDLYKMHLGREIISAEIPGYDKNLTVFTGQVQTLKYITSADYPTKIINLSTGIPDYKFVVDHLIQDERRNHLIIEWLNQAIRFGHSVFVFSEYRKHIDILVKIYKNQHNPQNIIETEDAVQIEIPMSASTVVLMGGASNEQVEFGRTAAQIIFTTYRYSSTGVSFGKMTSIIQASPRKSNTVQLLGRILRQGFKVEVKRFIIDIVDERIEFLNRQYKKRKNTYKNYSFDIDEKTVN